jgi:hypothetical protein
MMLILTIHHIDIQHHISPLILTKPKQKGFLPL